MNTRIYADNAVKAYVALNAEIKRVSAQMKSLRTQKEDIKRKLYTYMTELDLEELHGITRKSIEPKIKITAEDRAQSAIEFLNSQGIENPGQFYEILKKTQTKSYIVNGSIARSEGDDDDSEDGPRMGPGSGIPHIVYKDPK